MTHADGGQPDGRGPEPMHSFRFNGSELHPVDEYSQLQRAIMPVVGMASGRLQPFATCFGISRTLPLVVTAWHVVESFIEENRQGLQDGLCHLAVLYETDDRIPDTQIDLGGPLPVFEVAHLDGSDLALMTLWDVTSGERRVAPASVAPIGFEVPPDGDYCYGFGYPQMKGGSLLIEGDRRVVDFERTMHRTGGRVIEAFPDGQQGHTMVSGPSLHCDAPAPFGMSGGPVSTDTSGICGAISSAIAPFGEDEPWTSYVTLLRPLLEFVLTVTDESGTEQAVTIRELVLNGDIDAKEPLPPPMATPPRTTRLRFGRPQNS